MITRPDLSLVDRRIVITGATGGIGRVIAEHLASLGASLALIARSARDLDRLLARLPGESHDVVALDVADERAWARERDRLPKSGRVHGLVTAAALIAPVGPIGTWDVDAFRRTLDVNVVGTLLAIATTLEALRETSGSIVTFSGGGATAPFRRFDAYATSKSAVVRLTENLALELAGDAIRANSVAPGFVVTPMHDATLSAGPDTVGHDYFERTRQAAVEGGGDPPELAAELAAFLLSDAAVGISGKLLSARWDPWRDPVFQDRLRHDPDLATIRRIDDQFFTCRAKGEP